MFNIRNYIMKTLKGMVGNYPDFQIMEYALNWYAKGKLTEEGLAEVESWFEADEQEATENNETMEDEQMDEGADNNALSDL